MTRTSPAAVLALLAHLLVVLVVPIAHARAEVAEVEGRSASPGAELRGVPAAPQHAHSTCVVCRTADLRASPVEAAELHLLELPTGRPAAPVDPRRLEGWSAPSPLPRAPPRG